MRKPKPAAGDATSLEEIPIGTVAPTNDISLVSLVAFLVGAGGWVVAVRS